MSTILVIGGGIAGLTAAIEAAETGYDVIIVEKKILTLEEGLLN